MYHIVFSTCFDRVPTSPPRRVSGHGAMGWGRGKTPTQHTHTLDKTSNVWYNGFGDKMELVVREGMCSVCGGTDLHNKGLVQLGSLWFRGYTCECCGNQIFFDVDTLLDTVEIPKKSKHGKKLDKPKKYDILYLK